MKTEIRSAITSALAALEGRDIKQVYLVACGGSLSIMHPGKYFLDRHSKVINADVLNADEFVCRDPQRLDANAVVVLCSQTGTTKETALAAKFARAKGALTIAMTMDDASPLGKSAEHVVPYEASYTTGVPIDAADSNYAVLYSLLAGLVRAADGVDLTASLQSSLANLQAVIDSAHETFASRFEDYAPRLAKKDVVYTLSSGADYGAAYSFSICVLMEMQWINSQAIHADEFFHGPFEVTDEDMAFVVLVGLDETRRLEERARDFVLRFGKEQNVLVLDAKDLDMSNIDEAFQGLLIPLVFFDTLWRFAYKIAELRNQPMLEGRRYMKKISGY